MARVHVNNYSSTLNGGITAVATSIVVTSATGLPTLGSNTINLTLDDGAGNIEIVKVTAIAGATLTVVRAQEGTTGYAFLDTTPIHCRATRDSIDTRQEAISGATLTAATVATDDKVIIQDTSDSNNIKTVTAQSIADLNSGGIVGPGTENVRGGTSSLANWTSGTYNACYGFESGQGITTADYSVAIGANAMGNGVATGDNNTAIGQDALKSNTSGINNIALGLRAADAITTSSYNVAIGEDALGALTTAIGNNTAIGYNAGALITGESNVAIGVNAAKNWTSCGYSIKISTGGISSAYTGNYAVIIGFNGGNSLTSGDGAVLLGYQAGTALTGGTGITMIGYNAGRQATSATGCVLIGREAGDAQLTASDTTKVGFSSGKAGTGSGDTCFGSNAGLNFTSGGNNTCVGYNAGKSSAAATPAGVCFVGKDAGLLNTASSNCALGASALAANTSGTQQCAFGYQALTAATGGSNTAIGYQAGSALTTGSNCTLIGNSAAATAVGATNEITLGNASVATLRCQVTSITALSDARDKTDIQELKQGLDFIDSLKPVKFTWNMRDGAKVGIEAAGFIAQDLKKAQENADAAHLALVYESNPDRLEATYGNLIPVLVQAIKDLKKEIEELKKAK